MLRSDKIDKKLRSYDKVGLNQKSLVKIAK